MNIVDDVLFCNNIYISVKFIIEIKKLLRHTLFKVELLKRYILFKKIYSFFIRIWFYFLICFIWICSCRAGNREKDDWKNGKRIYTKTYQNATIEDDGDGYKVVIKKRTAPVSTLKLCENEFSNDNATKDLVEVLGKKDFDYSKPVSLLYFIEKLATHPSSSGTFRPPVILDFFAGSGTTLHATLNLNKEDGGIRQCILVQQSEGDNNICENVTYERNRRVMCGYTNAKGESVDGLGGSLKYYKTGFVGKHQSKNANDADKVELAEKAGCLIALAENTLEAIKVPKAAKGFWQIFSDNAERKKRYTCIYHNGDYGKVSDFVAKIDELRAMDKKSKFMVYVFSWNSPDFFENEFDDLKNIEIKAIPKPILEIYKALNG